MPRFAFEKFPQADDRLTTQMKAVGEVMAIGRTFQESFQKALRGLETGKDGLDSKTSDREQIVYEISDAGPERIFYVGDAFRIGMTLKEVQEATNIDPWFLIQIQEIIDIEKRLEGRTLSSLTREELLFLKQKGFSDRRLAKLLHVSEDEVRSDRWMMKLHPSYKRVDTCAAEFKTTSAYLYSTYHGASEADPDDRKKVVVLGGGPNRIGQGIEFDYCCVHAAHALREDGYETIMVNCNPETVSTDYDTSDRLFFEPVTLEDVLEICRIEKPFGVIVQYGGQTPINLCRKLEKEGVPILGTTPDSIDIAEDRGRFQKLASDLGILQPPNRAARSEEDAIVMADEIGYPLVLRAWRPRDGYRPQPEGSRGLHA
jgi:carbamoyl-phosphate synthase large subunit